MALSAVYVSAAAAVAGTAVSYQQGKKAAGAAEDAAAAQRVESAASTEATNQAASNATKLAQAGEQAKANETLAAAQMTTTPTVATGTGDEPNRLRRVKAAFNLDATNGAGNAGSVRV